MSRCDICSIFQRAQTKSTNRSIFLTACIGFIKTADSLICATLAFPFCKRSAPVDPRPTVIAVPFERLVCLRCALLPLMLPPYLRFCLRLGHSVVLMTPLSTSATRTFLPIETANVHRIRIRTRLSGFKERFDFRTNTGFVWQTSWVEANVCFVVFRDHF